MILEQGTTMSKSRKLMLLGTTAMIASFGFAPMAYAQNADGTEVAEDEIVITGIRQSLKEARDLKRDADTAVDSITASDVGSLPDLSVAEALSRIPGVVAQRFDKVVSVVRLTFELWSHLINQAVQRLSTPISHIQIFAMSGAQIIASF